MTLQATDIVMAASRAVLPEGSPLPFTEVKSAAFAPPQKSQVVAEVVMFDGLPATMRLTKWRYGWSIGWDEMPGGDCSLEGEEWVRVARAQEPKP